MSAGGINVQQPLVGSPPSTGGVQPQGAAPITAAAPVAAPGLTSPAATTATSFAPVAGQQAGSVTPSGGLTPEDIARTAAIGTGVATDAYGRAAAANQAAATVAGQQVVDPASVQPSAAAAATQQRGPAAWGEDWAKKFKDAGAPAEIIQQLTFTGAMGADEAQLQQMLDQIKGEIDTQLAKFAHEHPEEFKKLRSNPAVDRGMLAQIAAGVNGGQVKEEQLTQLVDSIGKSQGKMLFDTLVKPMIVWSLIPGWGALRLGFAPFTGGKDPLTGEKMFGDKMSTAFTIMAGIGGGITLFNHARGAMQVAQGHKLVTAGGDAAKIAAAEGFGNLTGMQKLASYIPGTNSNRVFSGISRLNGDLTQGISHLKGVERELAENVVNKWRNGEVSILGDPASKWTKMGFQPNARGMIIGKNKAMITVGTHNGKPALFLDGRMMGKTTAAHIAAAGVELADDTVLNNGLKSRLFGEISAASHTDPNAIKLLRDRTLGNATQQLLDANYIARPAGNKFISWLRPGPMQDALNAADNITAGTIGKAYGTAGIPKMLKFGVGGLAAAGAGYFLMVKPQLDAAKKAKEEAEKQAAEQAKAQQGGGQQGGQAQVTPELQQALDQFSKLPKDQQAQIIQQQYATLQQASQTPNLTPEQQQEIVAASQELELFMQVANGGQGAAAPAAGAGAGAGSVMGGGDPAAAAGAGAPAAGAQPQGQFTAQGLGLA